MILRNRWLKICGVLYLVTLVYLLYFAAFRDGTNTHVNLIPFKSIIAFFSEFHWPHWWYWILNIPGNIIAFIPIPFIIYSWRKQELLISTKVIVSILIPVLIETLQFAFQRGQSNIDDVLLNALGFLLGFYFLERQLKKTKLSPPKFE